jgi:hypothetical protein
MTVRVDNPAIVVELLKVARLSKGEITRQSGGQRRIDLSGWLTEDASVTVSRSINEAAGTFQITLSDRPVPHAMGGFDSLYGVVEPMDVIEIRMARRPHEYESAGKLPLVFRGLVTGISRDESMGQDGRPRRIVSVSGQDFGKFFQIIQNRYYRGGTNAADWLSNFRMMIVNDIPYLTMTAGEMVTLLINNIANAFIRRIGSAAIPVFTVDASGADPVDKVYPQGVAAMPGGVLWTYLQQFGDLGPFYELYIDDEEAGPKVVYRKPPFITGGGQSVYGLFPEGVVIDPVDITRLSVSRSDADVANWFWVEHPHMMFVQGLQAVWMNLSTQEQSPFVDTPSTDRALYGERPMEATSHHGSTVTPGAEANTNNRETVDYLTYQTTKRVNLQQANKDNVLFESGQIVMAGNERVKVGRGLYVRRGESTSFYYAQSVTHNFQPFRAFTTTVNFTRGTGFLARAPSEFGPGVLPYLDEIGPGPYGAKR